MFFVSSSSISTRLSCKTAQSCNTLNSRSSPGGETEKKKETTSYPTHRLNYFSDIFIYFYGTLPSICSAREPSQTTTRRPCPSRWDVWWRGFSSAHNSRAIQEELGASGNKEPRKLRSEVNWSAVLWLLSFSPPPFESWTSTRVLVLFPRPALCSSEKRRVAQTPLGAEFTIQS